RANADRDGFDQAYVKGVICGDCRIDARMVGFGTEMALTLRGSPAAPKDRYDLAITSAGRLRIRRWRSGSVTVLGDVPSGIPDLGKFTPFSFTVTGTAPVILTGAVNGVTKLTVTDGSSAALTAPGLAGMTNTMSGSWVDDFQLTALGSTPEPPPPPSPPPDGGVDGGTPPDAGTPAAHLLLDVVASGTDVHRLGDYLGLTAHSFAELDGVAYFVEYQVFTRSDAPIHLWSSSDAGRTWSLRATFTGHRHAHGLAADPARHALWAFF